MPDKAKINQRWGLQRIILLSMLPVFLLSAALGVLFNYFTARENAQTLFADFFQQRRMELKFIANLPTLKIYIMDLRLGLQVEAAFFRQELEASLEQFFLESNISSSHRFSVVSAAGEELLTVVDGKIVQPRQERISPEKLLQLQASHGTNGPPLPSYAETISGSHWVTDTWRLLDPIHGEMIGGLVYDYQVPVEHILDRPRRVLWFNLLYSFVGLAVLFSLFFLIIGYHIKPLHLLTEAVRRIIGGSFDQPVIPLGSGEVLTLAESFEKMRSRLQQSFFDIGHKNIELSESLEQQRRISGELAVSQDRFLQLGELSRTFVWELDRDGLFLSISPVVEDVLGYRPQELVGKRYYHELCHFPDGAVASGEILYARGGEKVFLATDGRQVAMVGTSMILFDDQGNCSGYYGSDTDISEKKKAEKENERLQLQLQHAQKMEAVGTMAGGIAHDFNNLLQVINGYAQLLLARKTSDDPDHESLRRIHSTGERAAGLIRQLLNFSRNAKNDRVVLDLNHEVEETAKMWRQSLPKMIASQLKLAENTWPISADPGQIQQILLNLVTNAAHAMPEGGQLEIATDNVLVDSAYASKSNTLSPGPYVLLVVADNGCGMDQQTLERIFDPFFTTKEVGQGTGLGLASVYGIVKSYGGHVTCTSEPGKGTEFSIYFPANREAPREIKSEAPPVAGIKGKETLLIVDDEMMIRDLTGGFFSSLGYSIMVANTGEEALEICGRHGPEIDLVLLDMNMPGMGGFKCLEQLRQSCPHLKVLIASGYSSQGPLQNTLALGAKGFIGKPYRLEELGGKIRQILEAPA